MKKSRNAWKPQSPLARKMADQLKVIDRSEKSVEHYLSAVRHLAEFYGCLPDRLKEQQVRDYLLLRKRQLQPNSMRPLVAGLKFFYTKTCPRQWETIRSLRIAKSRTVPKVLAREEVTKILRAERSLYYRTFFSTVYGCGLRQSEARLLGVNEIDGKRQQLTVRGGKGRKDRCVPLARDLYQLLQRHWCTHRHPEMLFPSRQVLAKIRLVTKPISQRSVQRRFEKLLPKASIKTPNIVLHTLRHSYATHLLDEGVNLKLIQQYLGHTTLQTTEIYLHVTQRGHDHARQVIEGLLCRDHSGQIAE